MTTIFARNGIVPLACLLAITLACGPGSGEGPRGEVIYTPWTQPVRIEPWGTTSAYDPSIAVDSYGNALATWNGKQNSASTPAIWANTYTSSSNWTSMGSLASLTGAAAEQKIVCSGPGLATVVWTQGTSTGSIQASRYSPLSGFASAVQVNTGTTDARSPAVAMDDQGNAMAAWLQSDGTHYHVMASRYSTLTGWAAPVLLDMNTTQEARNPAVAMDAAGNAVVVWHQTENLTTGLYSVWACHYWTSGSWSEPLNIQASTGDARNPAIAMSTAGAQAAWSETTSDGKIKIYTSRYTLLDDEWTTPQALSNATFSEWPSVGIDQSGNTIVTWADYLGNQSYAAMGTRYSITRGWEAAASFNHGVKDAGVPVVSMNGSGTAVIAWNQQESTNLNLYAVRYANAWEDTYLVSPTEGGEAYSPSVSIGSSGDIWAAWMQWDPSAQVYHVMASTYLEP